ncbi:DUF3180 domain-containing protein [Janibacter terrae]|uniref:DUF3180 domain-containing protein n=1 Tax=Janibacter terrae TaxID=103817 RepID=A0ABZ2F9U0_9MICO
MLSRGLRLPTVLAVVVGTGVLSWSVGRWWLAGGNAPLRVGWLAGVLLLGMAVVVVAAGARMWRMRHGRTHVAPVVAARILGLAQASSLTGAVMAGLDLGQALVLLPDRDFAGRGELALWWALGGAGALALVAAGLLVQSWCRIGGDEDEPPDGRERPGVS